MYAPFDLDRFLDAQASTYAEALSELQAGRKRSHWMWFIFPQLAGLGRSAMARFYGIVSFAEAEAYLEHEILGARLLECTQAALDAKAPSLTAYLDSPDDLKFRSCMTLFCAVGPDPNSVFKCALDRWCEGQSDKATLDFLAGSTPK